MSVIKGLMATEQIGNYSSCCVWFSWKCIQEWKIVIKSRCDVFCAWFVRLELMFRLLSDDSLVTRDELFWEHRCIYPFIGNWWTTDGAFPANSSVILQFFEDHSVQWLAKIVDIMTRGNKRAGGSHRGTVVDVSWHLKVLVTHIILEYRAENVAFGSSFSFVIPDVAIFWGAIYVSREIYDFVKLEWMYEFWNEEVVTYDHV